MIKHREDSIKELNEKTGRRGQEGQTIAEQGATIELLKGCIMELAAVIYGEGGEVTMSKIVELYVEGAAGKAAP